MYFKYLSLQNIGHVKDIFENKRMYAAEFEQLNDPMEGIYLYDAETFKQNQVEQLYRGKKLYRVLSMSSSFDNMLLWSHYADGHKGIAIGVSLEQSEVEKVAYVDTLSLNDINIGVAKTLLTRKLTPWAYEKEHRVLVQGTTFVPVEIRQVWLGIHIRDAGKKRIQEFRDTYCKDVEIMEMTRSQLDGGNLQQSGFLPEEP